MTPLGKRCRVPISAAKPMSTSFTQNQASLLQYLISHAVTIFSLNNCIMLIVKINLFKAIPRSIPPPFFENLE